MLFFQVLLMNRFIWLCVRAAAAWPAAGWLVCWWSVSSGGPPHRHHLDQHQHQHQHPHPHPHPHWRECDGRSWMSILSMSTPSVHSKPLYWHLTKKVIWPVFASSSFYSKRFSFFPKVFKSISTTSLLINYHLVRIWPEQSESVAERRPTAGGWLV